MVYLNTKFLNISFIQNIRLWLIGMYNLKNIEIYLNKINSLGI